MEKTIECLAVALPKATGADDAGRREPDIAIKDVMAEIDFVELVWRCLMSRGLRMPDGISVPAVSLEDLAAYAVLNVFSRYENVLVHGVWRNLHDKCAFVIKLAIRFAIVAFQEMTRPEPEIASSICHPFVTHVSGSQSTVRPCTWFAVIDDMSHWLKDSAPKIVALWQVPARSQVDRTLQRLDIKTLSTGGPCYA